MEKGPDAQDPGRSQRRPEGTEGLGAEWVEGYNVAKSSYTAKRTDFCFPLRVSQAEE